MFDIGYSELLLIGIVALVVVGPKELPALLRTVGNWVGRARSMARHFRAGFDTMVREAELEEMNRKWAEHNAAIMAATHVDPTALDPTPATPSERRHDPEADDDAEYQRTLTAAPESAPAKAAPPEVTPTKAAPSEPPVDSDKQMAPPPAP